MPTGNPISVAELWQALARAPRFPLGHFPTPLEPLRKLTNTIGGPTFWIKRDDCTGLLMGGNKTRHNEYLLGAALVQGADIFVWGAGVQSNNCRQTAAGCAKAGIECELYLTRKTVSGPITPQGNLLLDHIVGAKVTLVDAAMGPELDALIAARADELQRAGRHPFSWRRDVVTPLAAIGYVPCVLEIVEQCRAQHIEPSALYVSAAGSTGAGVALAAAALGLKCVVHSIAPMTWPWDTATDMAQMANAAAKLLGLPHRLEPQDINLTEEYIAPSYGVPGPDCFEAMSLLARQEAILVDPIYSGKALAGAIDHARSGMYSHDEHIVFIHTGGTPVVFAMPDQLLAGLSQ